MTQCAELLGVSVQFGGHEILLTNWKESARPITRILETEKTSAKAWSRYATAVRLETRGANAMLGIVHVERRLMISLATFAVAIG